jgi:hypothetical protein
MADKTKRRQRRAERLKAELLKSKEGLRVYHQAGESVVRLIRLAEDGDELSVRGLLMLACVTVDAIGSIARRRPELVHPFSRNSLFWPAFISRKRAFTEANKKLIDTVQLGTGGILSERQWQPLAPSTHFAQTLFVKGQLRAFPELRLPFTRKTKEQWFEKNWNAWLKEGFKPEESELLAPLGKSKATKKPKYCKNLRKATQDANVRAEIKAKVWKAFDKIFAV